MKPRTLRWPILLGTLIGATLLLTGVTVYWNFVFFPPGFTGWGEVTRDRTIAGWVINRRDPSRRVEVELYIDDKFVGNAMAELPRPDVVAAGWTPDPRCGYLFPIPSLAPGQHEARVFALHRTRNANYITLQQAGNPLRFSVTADGSIDPAR